VVKGPFIVIGLEGEIRRIDDKGLPTLYFVIAGAGWFNEDQLEKIEG